MSKRAQQQTPWVRPKDPEKSGLVWRYGKIAGLVALFFFWFGLTQYAANAFRQDGFLPCKPLFTVSGWHIFIPGWFWVWEFQFWRWVVSGGTHASSALTICLVAGMIGSIFVFRFVAGPVTHWLARSYVKDTQDVYGSSRFAEKKDIVKAELLPRDGESLVGGVVLGAWIDPDNPSTGHVLRDCSDRHVINIASTRSGKTASAVVPTALEWNKSLLVTDMKGEIFEKTAGWRQKQGHRIIRFAPMEPENSSRLNPLDSVRLGTEYEISDAQKLADWLCHPGGEVEKDSHWNDTAQQLVAGMILYEIYKCRLRYGRQATMKDIAFGLGPYGRNQENGQIQAIPFTRYLDEAIAFEVDPEHERGFHLPDGSPTACHPFILQTMTVARQRAGDEAASVLSSASKRFFVYQDTMVAKVTGGSDFAPEDLMKGDKPVSFYLVVPPSEKDRLAPLVRVICSWFVSRLTEKEGEWKHELLMLLDEFPSLGYVKPLESSLSYTGSYGIRFFLICQDLGQITKRYGRENEILPNCQLKLLFTPGELATAKEISESLGSVTVRHASVSFNEQKLIPDGKSFSVQQQQHHRKLLEPDELMKLELPEKRGRKVIKPGQLILLVHGFAPIIGVQTMWFLNDRWRKQVGLPASLERIEPKKSVRDEMEAAIAASKENDSKNLRDWADAVAAMAVADMERR